MGFNTLNTSGSPPIGKLDNWRNGLPITSIPIIVTRATACYSLRQIYGDYLGNAIRVRRSLDDAFQDIGFVGGVLDVTSLTSFVGAGNGFVVTWYDSSGNGNHTTNADPGTQPKIVINGSVNLFNSRPAIRFSQDLQDVLFNSAIFGFAANTDFYISAVFEFLQAANSWDMIAGWRDSVNTATNSAPLLQAMNVNNQIGMHNTDAVDTRIKVDITTRIEKRIATLSRAGGTNGNGGTVTVTSTGNSQPSYETTAIQSWSSPPTSGFQIGGRQQGATAFGDKNITEVICFSQDLNTANRNFYRTEQGSYYGISVP